MFFEPAVGAMKGPKMLGVVAVPDLMSTAAGELAQLGSTLNVARLTAAAPTVSLLPAAADEVSAGIANFMSAHALAFQSMVQSASTFHQQFAHNVNAAAASYSSAESGIAATLTPTFPSLADFFQYGESDFGAAIGSFVNSFGSFPNLAWGQLGRAADDALVLLLWPITYPITAVSVYVVEALLDAIVNAFIA